MLLIVFCSTLCFGEAVLENGLRLNYEVSGVGEPLLLIGGLGNRLNVWDDLTPLLDDHFKVYRFDNRGIGESGDLEEAYTLETMADDAAGLMASLDIEHYHLAGISLGSFAAQKLALKYPERVTKLVLIASTTGGKTHVLPDQEVLTYFQTMAQMERPERVKKGLLLALYPDFTREHPEKLDTLVRAGVDYVPPATTIQRQMMIGMMFNHAEAVAGLETPTLLLHGEDDRVVPAENARRLHGLIKDSRLHLIEKSGHICIIDQKKAAAAAILDFLR